MASLVGDNDDPSSQTLETKVWGKLKSRMFDGVCEALRLLHARMDHDAFVRFINLPIPGTRDQWTALHIAADWGRLDIVRFLIEQGADKNATSRNNDTPLHFAARCTSEQTKAIMKLKTRVVQYLLDSDGVTPNAENSKQNTPLHVAAKCGHLEAVEYLVKQGAKIDSANRDGRSPIKCAASARKVKVVDFLQTKGASLEDMHDFPKQIKCLHLQGDPGNHRKCKSMQCKHKCCKRYQRQQPVLPTPPPAAGIPAAILKRGVSLEYSELYKERGVPISPDQYRSALNEHGTNAAALGKALLQMGISEPDGYQLRCVRCQSAKAVVQYLPCEHIIHCVACSAEIRNLFGDQCPSCHGTIAKVLYAFQNIEVKTECDICADEWPNTHMIELTGDHGCSHLTCVACALDYFRFEVLNKKLKILNDQGILCPMQGCHVKTDPYAINRLRRVSSECGTIVIPEGTYTPGLGFTEKTVSPLTLKEREKLEDLYEEALIDPARRLYCVKCAHVHDVEPVPEDRVPFQVNCTVKQETETLP